jgi:hypothetical protein
VRNALALTLWMGTWLLAAAASAQPTGLEALGNLGKPRPDPDREWTVLMYMAGDNDLEADVLLDMNRIEANLPARGVEIIVLLDRAKGYSKRDADWTEARVYRIRRGYKKKVLESELLARCGELNLGDPKVLQTFTAAGLKAFPAKRRALFLANHGGGWIGMCNDDDAPGGKKGKDKLELLEVRNALSAALTDAGLKRLDLLCFDMCLAGQLEIAHACKDLAEVQIFSEGLSYGLQYDAFTQRFGDKSLSTRQLAVQIIRDNGKLGDKRWSYRTNVFAAVDSEKIDGLITALDAVAAKLTAAAEQHWATLCRAHFFSETYVDRLEYRKGTRAYHAFDLMTC